MRRKEEGGREGKEGRGGGREEDLMQMFIFTITDV